MNVILATTAAAAMLAATAASAQSSLTAKPASGHPTQSLQLTGAGFAAAEPVDILLDTTDTALLVSSSSGTVGYSLAIPASAQPGAHQLTAVGRRSGNTAHAKITVSTPWTQAGYGAAKRGWTPYENTLTTANAGQLAVAWAAAGTGGIGAPVVANGRAYVSTLAGVQAIVAATGAVKWTALNTTAFAGGPALDGNLVVVADTRGTIYGFTPSGYESLQLSGGCSVAYAGPTVANGIAYQTCASGKNAAYKLSNGTLLWTYTAGGAIRGSAALANGVLYAGASDDKLYALNAATGALLWTYTAGGQIVTTPATANGVVYFGATDGNLYAISTAAGSAGTMLWSYQTGSAITTAPVVAYGQVFAGNSAGAVYAFDAPTGRLNWSDATGAAIHSIIAGNGVVYFTNDDGDLDAADASTGAALAELPLQGVSYGGAALSDGRLYVDTNGGPAEAVALP